MKVRVKLKQRDVLICVLLGLIVVCLFSELNRLNGKSECLLCESRRPYQGFEGYSLGYGWRSQKSGVIEENRFLLDFPEYDCDHEWIDWGCRRSVLWESPIVDAPYYDGAGYWRSRSAIVARYGSDEEFRTGVKRLLSKGILSQERLLELAGFHCMDGGTCQMSWDDEGERSLRKLIEKE